MTPTEPNVASGTAWYALTPEDVEKRLDVDPARGLSAAKAAELLQKNGPNALPAEATVPGWKQFLAQYRSYMQIILVAAAVASIADRRARDGHRRLGDHGGERVRGDAPAGQGRERHECAAVDAQGVRPGPP